MTIKMKVIMLLVALLVVVFAGSRFSWAEDELNSEVEIVERSSNRLGRRDLQSFQKQIQALLPFNIANKTLCPTAPCIGALVPKQCFAFNTSTFGQVNILMNVLTTCYTNGFCGANFANRTVSNVNVPLAAPANYAGQCYLYGPRVGFNFKQVSYDTKNLDPHTASYIVYETINYTFTGLSVRCQPCPTPPPPTVPPPTPKATACPTTNNNNNNNQGSSGGGQQNNCCSANLITQLLCVVQNLLYSLGLRLQLVSCDCTCTSWNSGKREATGPENPVFEPRAEEEAERELNLRQAAAAFDSPVDVIRLSISYQSFLVFRAGLDPLTQDAAPRVSTTVTLGSAVPDVYRADLIAEIQDVINDYNIFYFLLYYYNAIINDLMLSFYRTCPGAY